MECAGRASTVRVAATSAWPITCPPNTRCQFDCGLKPRNRFTSNRSRSSSSSRLLTAFDMMSPAIPTEMCLPPRDSQAARIHVKTGGMSGSNERLDVLIAGAGIAGLALAAALARALKPNFAIAVCDPALGQEPAADERVSAIAPGARQLLEALGVWQQNEAKAQ